jgi:hypothetical protein
LRLFFLWEIKLVDRESRLWRDYAQEASAQLFRIADSWLLVAGFSLLVPSLPMLDSFNQQQGTSNKELIFQSAFRNLQSAIWRRGKGSARDFANLLKNE